ncbi:MAG TPA: hypothetical protein VMH40_21930 [Myxococcaceae bacterium]|nr:hypothetical protein [Myxococcaceae bacterium]
MRLDVRTLLAAVPLLALGCGAGVAPSGSGASGSGAGAAMAPVDPAAGKEAEHHRSWFFIVPRPVPIDGRTTLGWIPEFWRYLYSVPASQNPELNPSADCGVGQSGPVFFIPGEQTDVYTRDCTVPEHKPVLFSIWSAFNDYPCPDPTFQPAPGQSLVDFLAQGAQAFDDAVSNLAATIDGKPIDVSRYRYTTGLVSFTGDPSLTATFDGCVTGTRQVGVADGWFVLLLLSPGDHTLVVTATSPGGHATSQTFVLHVVADDD